jgi:hypothetical protein
MADSLDEAKGGVQGGGYRQKKRTRNAQPEHFS